MKIFIKIPLMILISLLIVNSVYADGWHISNHDLHLYEPNQKAVISWDGETETMVLASAVKSNDIANFAWVIPIQSSSKPEVTAGNISIFEDLVNYFKKEDHSYWGKRGSQLNSEGVNILESKEIDVYDITILQATNSNDLITWLNDNGYQVPEEAKPILDKYIEKGDFYFVANKIDLTNKYREVIDFVEDYNSERNATKTYSKYLDENIMTRYLSYYNSSMTHIIYDLITTSIMANIPFDIAKEKGDNFAFISKEDYEKLRKDYAIEIKEDLASLSKGQFVQNIVKKLMKCDTTGCVSYMHVLCNNPSAASTVIYVADEKWALSGQWAIFAGQCNDVISNFGNVDIAEIEISKIPFNDIFENTQIVRSKVQEIVESELEPIGSMKQKLKELSNAKSSLKKGMSTPLKFEFWPNQPYYPLEISSLNLGRSIIEVYVLTTNPVTDQNDVLTVEKSKMINSELKKKLEKHINLVNARYVTRLSYNGNLKDLTADAEFSYEKKYGFFRIVWNWISDLFA